MIRHSIRHWSEAGHGPAAVPLFGLSDGFWTGLQLDHDMANAREALADVLASITPHVVSQ